MTQSAAVSIVVVSRPGRAQILRRCLIALSQLRYDLFEIVVVADASARSMLRELPQAAHVKLVPFDEVNVSAARNAGISHADGEVIALTEDDSVPEPSWLTHLAAPFQVAGVGSAAGFVRGIDGFAWLHQAATVDRTGRERPLAVDADQPTLLTASAGQGVRSHSANMAVHRDLLEELGGFDPGYRQDLGVLDLNLRLAQLGTTTAVVPKAVVYRGLGNCVQHRDGVADPSFYDIVELQETGAAWALLLRRHCEPGRHRPVWRRLVRTERQKLVCHMISGLLEPRDVRGALKALQEGFREGTGRRQTLLRPIRRLGGGFRTYPSNRVESVVLSGHKRQLRQLRLQAGVEVAAGRIVTVMAFSRSLRPHRLCFSEQGFWEQTGGLFSRSVPGSGALMPLGLTSRIERETDQVRALRLVTA